MTEAERRDVMRVDITNQGASPVPRALRMARHSFSAVAGSSNDGAAICANASLTAFITAGIAQRVPASPTPLPPSGFRSVKVGLLAS